MTIHASWGFRAGVHRPQALSVQFSTVSSGFSQMDVAPSRDTLCCPPDAGPPVALAYSPQGTRTLLGDLPVYQTGDPNSKKALIALPDIFSFGYAQIFQASDRLSAGTGGALVLALDPFKGAYWTEMEITPGDPALTNWVQKEGSWSKVKADVVAAVQHVTALGATSIGIVGFCWGASIAVQAGIEGLGQAVAGVHPSFFGMDKELAEALEVPLCLLPANGDPAESLQEVLDLKHFGNRCVFRRFDKQTHGFCGARGDWSKPEVADAATLALRILCEFFNANLS